MTPDDVDQEIEKFQSKIKIAEETDTYVVLTPPEAQIILQIMEDHWHA